MTEGVMEINNVLDDAPYNIFNVYWGPESLDADGNPKNFSLYFLTAAPGWLTNTHYAIPHLSTDDTRGVTLDYTQVRPVSFIEFYLKGVFGAGGRDESGMIPGKKYTISVFVFRNLANSLT
jgi:hypothetical protein